MQHLEFAGHPTSFVLCGGGGADLVDLPKKASTDGPFAQKVHGFTHVQMTATLTTLRLIDDTGAVLHAFTKTPDGAVSILS